MTTEEFIQKAKAVHGDKYDYSKAEYIGYKEEICIICPEHGEFMQKVITHLSGCGCPICAGRKKMRTIDFIKKAQTVHGDKYDYSKVEYVNTHTRICIICPEHGEFWQVPSNHMRNHGCPKCAAAHVSEQISIWTREICYEEAKKYTSRGKFKEGCPYGYSSARKHGWLDDYTWFNPARKQVPAGYWTYERCYEEAKKYSSLKAFGEHANGALQYASKMGWTKDYTWFEKRFVWTKELCEEEARKCTKRSHFKKSSPGAYRKAKENGWLDEFFPK